MPTTASLETNVLNAGLADKPMCFTNKLQTLATTASWYIEASGSLNVVGSRSTETANTQAPGAWAYNGDPLLRTTPTAANTYAYWLYFEFSASQSLDSFALLNHNLNDASSLTERVDFLVTEASGATPLTVSTFTTPFDERLGFNWVDAGGTTVYESVEGVAVRFASSTTSTAWQPSVGEVVAGSRIQFPRKAIRPYAADNVDAGLEEFMSDAGQTYIFRKAAGRNVKEHRWQVETANDPTYTTINFLTQIRALRDQSEAFSYPFMWVENPATDNDDFRYVRAIPPWEAPYIEAGIVDYEMKLRELAPFYRAEQW